jgi:hypothetical protein
MLNPRSHRQLLSASFVSFPERLASLVVIPEELALSEGEWGICFLPSFLLSSPITNTRHFDRSAKRAVEKSQYFVSSDTDTRVPHTSQSEGWEFIPYPRHLNRLPLALAFPFYPQPS